jgi:Chain length determinant protein
MRPEPLLDLDRLVAGIWWRRHIWLSATLLGLLIGVLLAVTLPPQPTAVARVLLIRSDDQLADRTMLMETDVALFQTSQVASAALKEIGSSQRPADFLAMYHGKGITPNVLEIAVGAASDAEAVRRAQALADVLIAAHVTRAREAADGQANALLTLQQQLVKTSGEVSNTISETLAKGGAAGLQPRQSADISAQLDGLYARRAGLASQILDLGKRADDARLEVGRVAVGTQIVDSPRAITGSRARAAIIEVAVGLMLGLGAGLALAAVLSVTRDRPVLRRDIVARLGVPVIAQLPAIRLSAAARVRRGPRAIERRRAAASLARLIARCPGRASLLEIGCPRTAAVLALDIAEQLAAKRQVVLIDDLPRRHLRRASRASPGQVEIVDRADVSLCQAPPGPEPELVLRAGSAGPGASWVDLAEFGRDALLVVYAGRATAPWLHTVAQQLANAGIAPIGVVLVAPHPRDHSDGTVWEALHAANKAGSQRNGAVPHELSQSILARE